jgi:TatD DNase family protein
MYLVDTHAHLYLPQFEEDRNAVLTRATQAGVKRILLPNIDLASIAGLHELCDRNPGIYYPMMGLHPCDVKADFRDVLAEMKQLLDSRPYVAIGETGIDMYWDKTTLSDQIASFTEQIHWAIEKSLPIVIHARESFDEIFEVLDRENHPGLRGVFHCFTGSIDQAEHILGYGGFMMGLGGVLTYPKAALDQVVVNIPREKIVLETDAPFLPPVPYRGKRNESAYVAEVADRLATIWKISKQEVARITTENAFRMFFPDQSPPLQ